VKIKIVATSKLVFLSEVKILLLQFELLYKFMRPSLSCFNDRNL